MDKDADIFQSLNNEVQVRKIPDGILFLWSRKGIGFGMLAVRVERNNRLLVDDECMDEEFCMDVIRQAFRERIKYEKDQNQNKEPGHPQR